MYQIDSNIDLNNFYSMTAKIRIHQSNSRTDDQNICYLWVTFLKRALLNQTNIKSLMKTAIVKIF